MRSQMTLVQKAAIAKEHGLTYGKMEALLHCHKLSWENHNALTVEHKSPFADMVHTRIILMKSGCKDMRCMFYEKCLDDNKTAIELSNPCICRKKKYLEEQKFNELKRGAKKW